MSIEEKSSQINNGKLNDNISSIPSTHDEQIESYVDLDFLNELRLNVFHELFLDRKFDLSTLSQEEINIFIEGIFKKIFTLLNLKDTNQLKLFSITGVKKGITLTSFFGENGIGKYRLDLGIHILTAKNTQEMGKILEIYLGHIRTLLSEIKKSVGKALNTNDEKIIRSYLETFLINTVVIINGPVEAYSLSLYIELINKAVSGIGFKTSNISTANILRDSGKKSAYHFGIIGTRKKELSSNNDKTWTTFTLKNITELIVFVQTLLSSQTQLKENLHNKATLESTNTPSLNDNENLES